MNACVYITKVHLSDQFVVKLGRCSSCLRIFFSEEIYRYEYKITFVQKIMTGQQAQSQNTFIWSRATGKPDPCLYNNSNFIALAEAHRYLRWQFKKTCCHGSKLCLNLSCTAEFTVHVTAKAHAGSFC